MSKQGEVIFVFLATKYVRSHYHSTLYAHALNKVHVFVINLKFKGFNGLYGHNQLNNSGGKDACNTEQGTAISDENVVQNPLLRAFAFRRLGLLFNHHNNYKRCLLFSAATSLIEGGRQAIAVTRSVLEQLEENSYLWPAA